ncbi:MAG: arsenate reductase (glutaredoxin) [Gammaproteobacteria bacterium]|nr:arsenate reductase (glutaredoxin) [Gammaproteobacteria bacterium]
MSNVVIWHNPRCSKSRATLALLEERGIEPEIVLYLEQPPTAAELQRVIGMLGIAPAGLIRRGEQTYKELGLAAADANALIAAMAEHPILIERPLVIHGQRAALGRPPEQVLEIL